MNSQWIEWWTELERVKLMNSDLELSGRWRTILYGKLLYKNECDIKVGEKIDVDGLPYLVIEVHGKQCGIHNGFMIAVKQDY